MVRVRRHSRVDYRSEGLTWGKSEDRSEIGCKAFSFSLRRQTASARAPKFHRSKIVFEFTDLASFELLAGCGCQSLVKRTPFLRQSCSFIGSCQSEKPSIDLAQSNTSCVENAGPRSLHARESRGTPCSSLSGNFEFLGDTKFSSRSAGEHVDRRIIPEENACLLKLPARNCRVHSGSSQLGACPQRERAGFAKCQAECVGLGVRW